MGSYKISSCSEESEAGTRCASISESFMSPTLPGVEQVHSRCSDVWYTFLFNLITVAIALITIRYQKLENT